VLKTEVACVLVRDIQVELESDSPTVSEGTFFLVFFHVQAAWSISKIGPLSTGMSICYTIK